MANNQALAPAKRAGEEERRALSERERGISAGARRAAGRGDRAAAPHRAGGRAAPRAAAGRRGDEGLSFRGRERPASLRRPVRRQADARGLQLHVRAGARAAVPDVHLALSAWDGEAPDIEQRIALAVVARSPIERLVAFKKERGWRHLKLYSDIDRRLQPRLSRAVAEGGDDAGVQRLHPPRRHDPPFLERRDGLRDRRPRPGPARRADLMPLWTILDCTPEGRGTDWYPKLEYKSDETGWVPSGAPGRTRTSTMLPPPDFESGASTNSATGAMRADHSGRAGRVNAGAMPPAAASDAALCPGTTACGTPSCARSTRNRSDWRGRARHCGGRRRHDSRRVVLPIRARARAVSALPRAARSPITSRSRSR